MAKNKPGPWDNIGRGFKTFNKVVYEVSGAGDAKRFAKNPNIKNTASLAATIVTYAAGPALKGVQAARTALAVTGITRQMEARAALAAANATKDTRVVKAYKGAGALNTKAGTKVPVSGIKSFETGKSPTRAAASTRSQVTRDAADAGKKAYAKAQRPVTAAAATTASLVTGKTASTVTAQNRPISSAKNPKVDLKKATKKK